VTLLSVSCRLSSNACTEAVLPRAELTDSRLESALPLVHGSVPEYTTPSAETVRRLWRQHHVGISAMVRYSGSVFASE
jgi:hypothetical protein